MKDLLNATAVLVSGLFFHYRLWLSVQIMVENNPNGLSVAQCSTLRLQLESSLGFL